MTPHNGLVVLAIVLFVLAGFGIGAPRAQLGWFGLAAFALAMTVVA
jgi:hypothetical protein